MIRQTRIVINYKFNQALFEVLDRDMLNSAKVSGTDYSDMIEEDIPLADRVWYFEYCLNIRMLNAAGELKAARAYSSLYIPANYQMVLASIGRYTINGALIDVVKANIVDGERVNSNFQEMNFFISGNDNKIRAKQISDRFRKYKDAVHGESEIILDRTIKNPEALAFIVEPQAEYYSEGEFVKGYIQYGTNPADIDIVISNLLQLEEPFGFSIFYNEMVTVSNSAILKIGVKNTSSIASEVKGDAE